MELFKLGSSSSKRPDSERLLYQSSHQVLRPPTAPLTPNAPPSCNSRASSTAADQQTTASTWFMSDLNDGLPPPPSQPPTLNLFDSLNSVSTSFDDTPLMSPAAGTPAYAAAWDSTDARLSHIVDYLQQRGTSRALLELTPAAAEWHTVEEGNIIPNEEDVLDENLNASEGDLGGAFAPVSASSMMTPKLPPSRTPTQQRGGQSPQRSPAKSGANSSSSRHRANAQSRAPVKGWWKTEICKFWKESGGCRNENNCRWAHGEVELRSPTPEPGESASNAHPWVILDKLTTDLQCVWEILKIKNRSMRSAEENTLISGPAANVELDDAYWAAVQDLLSRNTPAKECDCCGSTLSSQSAADTPPSTPSSGSSERNCSTCKQIAVEKIQVMSLVPQASGGSGSGGTAGSAVSSQTTSPSHNDRKKLVYWGLSLANMIKNLDEFTWVPQSRQLSLSTDFNTEISHWAQHKRMIARAILLMRCYLDSLPSGRRIRLQTTELLPSLSLLDWCVVCNQPILYVSLLANEFPIQAALPSNVSWKPFTKKVN